jgi:hypothetical protein
MAHDPMATLTHQVAHLERHCAEGKPRKALEYLGIASASLVALGAVFHIGKDLFSSHGNKHQLDELLRRLDAHDKETHKAHKKHHDDDESWGEHVKHSRHKHEEHRR